MSKRYQPPFTISATIVSQVAAIGERIGRLSATPETGKARRLRRVNRTLTIQGSLTIERNTLGEAQVEGGGHA